MQSAVREPSTNEREQLSLTAPGMSTCQLSTSTRDQARPSVSIMKASGLPPESTDRRGSGSVLVVRPYLRQHPDQGLEILGAQVVQGRWRRPQDLVGPGRELLALRGGLD